MRVRGKIDEEQLDQMDLTLSITMTRAQWATLMRAQPAGPLVLPCRFGNAIATALGHVSKMATAEFAFDQ